MARRKAASALELPLGPPALPLAIGSVRESHSPTRAMGRKTASLLCVSLLGLPMLSPATTRSSVLTYTYSTWLPECHWLSNDAVTLVLPPALQSCLSHCPFKRNCVTTWQPPKRYGRRPILRSTPMALTAVDDRKSRSGALSAEKGTKSQKQLSAGTIPHEGQTAARGLRSRHHAPQEQRINGCLQ